MSDKKRRKEYLKETTPQNPALSLFLHFHMKKLLMITGILLPLLYSCKLINPLMIRLENAEPSISKGESYDGKLINGKRLPNKGGNFRAASYLLTAWGRNGVHDRLRDLVLEAYDSLHKAYPGRKYLYGETGWVKGGNFWPHYTHQNGLVIDFMVPVTDREKEPATLKTHLFNRWGYAYEFDSSGTTKKYLIDFESMSAHLNILLALAPKYHLGIRRIIFTPEFLPFLFTAKDGEKLKNIFFVQKPGWLRHDDHYHVEFELISE
jgi:penicillin-insensitive murein endopeptidase